MLKHIYPVLLGAYSVLTGSMAFGSTSGALGIRNSALERSVGEMVAVPAESFMMGSPSSEKDRHSNEGPQHLVSVKGFKIAKYDVTRGQWAAFVAATGRPAPPNDCYVWAGGQVTQNGSQLNPGFSQTDRDPIVCVSWNDVQDYLR